jgi:hypothetical protein
MHASSLLAPANSGALGLGIAHALSYARNAAFEVDYKSDLRLHIYAAVVLNQSGKATGLILTPEPAGSPSQAGSESRRMLLARESLRNIARESLVRTPRLVQAAYPAGPAPSAVE